MIKESLQRLDSLESVLAASTAAEKDNLSWLQLWDDEDWETQTLVKEGLSLIRLHNEESIVKAEKLHRSSSLGDRQLKKGQRRWERHTKKVASVPFVKNYPHLRKAHDEDFAKSSVDESIRKHHHSQQDTFKQYLNWASEQNPDGVNIVHESHDQGGCGSCWGWSATGSLEASASRRFAFQVYEQVVQNSNAATSTDSNNKRNLRHSKNDKFYLIVDDATHNHAVMLARDAESEAIRVADLSVQELVDCDTFTDQGCTGGNPLLAFYFIHRYGLTSATNYPYAGQEESCRVDAVASPIATVESWGILTPNHEDNMARVLRGIGPIAVGVDGTDPAFMSYSGGIFESSECEQTANHALLIVGYGEEVDEWDNSTVKYWIARNSWGTGWGENGFVRVKRGSGRKGEEGVCGIARSPSVALGGVLLPSSGISSTDAMSDINSDMQQTQRMETSLMHSYCDSLGLSDASICFRVESYFESHRVVLYCLISFFVCGMLVVLPLSKDCRLQRIRRRALLETAKRKRDRENGNPNSAGESAPLLRMEQPVMTYGAGAQ